MWQRRVSLAAQVDSWSEGKDVNGQWVSIDFTSGFKWDGTSNLLVDVGYNLRPWGQGSKSTTFLALAGVAANFLLRGTPGESRTAVVFGDPSNEPILLRFRSLHDA